MAEKKLKSKKIAEDMPDTEYSIDMEDFLKPLFTKKMMSASKQKQAEMYKKLQKKLEARNEMSELAEFNRQIRKQRSKGALLSKGGYVKKYARGGGVRKART